MSCWPKTVDANKDYRLELIITNDQDVELLVNGTTKVSHSFSDSLSDGEVGLGSWDSLSQFDDVVLQPYVPPPPPPSTTLPVLEDFEDGVADFFEVRSGTWAVQAGRYSVAPDAGQDGVSTLRIAEPLPMEFEIEATINADGVSTNRLSNAFVIFDYQGPLDFKFAGAYVGSNRWLMGRRTSAGWLEDVRLSETINANTDYRLKVAIANGNQVTLLVNGVTKLTRQFADLVNDGDLGVGTRNAFARFDDVVVKQPSGSLSVQISDSSNPYDLFGERSQQAAPRFDLMRVNSAAWFLAEDIDARADRTSGRESHRNRHWRPELVDRALIDLLGSSDLLDDHGA